MMPLKFIPTELDQVRSCLADLMHSGDPLLDPCLLELSSRQGKMLRPALVLLCGRLVASLDPLHIRLAAAVELIHTASLLHDDVIDQAQMRRSRPAANVLWGNTTAVLLGDFLLSRAFSVMAQDAPREAVLLLCQTAETLCRGELKQNLLRGRMDLTEQDYFNIIETKTAALFRCSCRLGALASRAEDAQQEAAAEFGYHIGMAFQIMDDLTDIRSSSPEAGKTLGTDFLHEKLTLPVIFWLNQEPSQKAERTQKLAGMSAGELSKLLETSGGIDYAVSLAAEHSRRATSKLAVFEPSDSKEALYGLAEHILDSSF